jgi:two-component system, chemotaxis family, chemotaxis protein CheY
MKVLIVDDSPIMRSLIKSALTSNGITELTEAEHGKQALETLKTGTFDLILLDWNMPELDGLQTLKEIKKSGLATPVMMVTTESEKQRVVEAICAGAKDYLIKPFEPAGLIAKVNGIFKRAAQPA